jgi:hypothetical protein
MPATVMMAAAAEATWIECGEALAQKLGHAKLQQVVRNPFDSISKKVAEIRKVLRDPGGAAIVKAAGQSDAQLNELETWTNVLRYRRNALHWGKAKSFVVEHSDTANLLLGAPIHLRTLEAIRAACC